VSGSGRWAVPPCEPAVPLEVRRSGVGVAVAGQERPGQTVQAKLGGRIEDGHGDIGHAGAPGRGTRPPTTRDLTAADGEPENPTLLVYTVRYTPVMSKTVPVREFRTHLAELLDEVADRREHVTVTRRGRPAAVLVPVDEYEALEETAEILSDEPTLAAIRRGLDELAAGEVVSLAEVRAEHAARDRS
jgi:antitoxin YefM